MDLLKGQEFGDHFPSLVPVPLPQEHLLPRSCEAGTVLPPNTACSCMQPFMFISAWSCGSAGKEIQPRDILSSGLIFVNEIDSI